MSMRLIIFAVIGFALFGGRAGAVQAAEKCKKIIRESCPKKSHSSPEDRLKCYKKIHKKLSKKCKKLNRKLFASMKKKIRKSKKQKEKEVEEAGSGWLYFLIPFLVLILWLQVCMYGIFSKARYNPWFAFVPFYNSYLFHRVAGVPPLWCVANLTPGFVYFWPQTCFGLAESFGQDRKMGITIALLPFVYLAILGFSKDIQYEGRGAMPKISFDMKL